MLRRISRVVVLDEHIAVRYSSMRFLFIGNVNNEPFRLAHELTRLGHAACVVPTSPTPLDDPGQLTSLSYYARSPVEVRRDVIDTRTWEWMSVSRSLRQHMVKLSHRADVIVGNSVGLSILPILERPFGAFVTGSDLTVYGNPDFVRQFEIRGRRTRWGSRLRGRRPESIVARFTERQQLGVSQAMVLVTMPEGVSQSIEDRLACIGANSVPRVPWRPFTPVDWRGIQTTTRSPGRHVRILVGSRLTRNGGDIWESSDLDDKGSMTILRGWALARQRGFNGRIAVFRKGPGVDAVQAATLELEVADFVDWLDERDFRGFLRAIGDSDVVIDSLGASPPGRVSIEALAGMRPLISRATERDAVMRFGAKFPQIVPAHDAESLASALLLLQSSGTDFARTPLARELVHEYLSPEANARPVNRILEGYCP